MELTKELVEKMFERGILLNADLKEISDNLLAKLEIEEDLIVLNADYAEVIQGQTSLVDWYELDHSRVLAEKEKDLDLYQNQLQHLRSSDLIITSPPLKIKSEIKSLELELNREKEAISENLDPTILNTKKNIKTDLNPNSFNFSSANNSSMEIVLSYENKPRKYAVKDFVNIFVTRYRFLESLLRNRQELRGTLSINRVLEKKEKENVSIIGMVEEVSTTKSGHLVFNLEDLTGKIKVLVSKNNKELFNQGKELVPDEVIGINGMSSDKIIFAERIVWPDFPELPELKKSPLEEYALFISDIHVGSKMFLKQEFLKFLRWLRGETGTEAQKALAQKVKYLVIAGDLVDGIGIYPSQEEELEINDITKQYQEFVELIKQVPLDKQIIVCPGNHDLVHLAEPQPKFYKEFSACLSEVPNLTLITNPGMINIGKTKNFSGFNVLVYHGYSFDYYVNNVEPIRNNGGYTRADLIMQFLLKRRHLAPSFQSTPYFPAHAEDPLLIKKIPDIFITGHIHYCKVANHKGVTLISGSCWQSKTAFQEKMGHEPEPGRVPIVNLQTREIKILKFV
ncbi:MAG TPA: DNA-directed DNA polymerase II small subunit [Candidatus Nanoarchaeia archaeon]|nr:DNA-directed DNA polymerase II small subunit [Candidatus Nanoarchaeia archaeon]